MATPRHFYKPPNSRCWYVRLVPPKHLRHAVEEKEFRRSTGHGDLKLARPIGMTLIADKLAEWEALARPRSSGSGTAPTALTQELIEAICSARLYSHLVNDEDDRLSGYSDDALAECEVFCAMTDTTMRSVLASGPASSRWNEVVLDVCEWCETMGYEVSPTDTRFPQLVRAFASVERNAILGIAKRNQGEPVETPPPPADQRRLSEVTEPYLAFKRTRLRSKHAETQANAWRLFVAFCGDIPLNEVTKTQVFGFFEARLHAKVQPWSTARVRGFGRSTLREAFAWARTQGWMSASNPVDDLDLLPSLSEGEEAGRKRPRFPFKSAQLNRLFASAWYMPEDTATFRGKMREDLGARYWVPLICLFHGTRVREALQLVASDFSSQGNMLVMHIRAELDDDGVAGAAGARYKARKGAEQGQTLRSVKNEATRRAVPVFPALVALGLEDFIAGRRARDGAHAWLFPSSLPESGSKSPKLGRAYEQAFLRYVRDRLEFGHGYGNHSFRHQLEDRVRKAQASGGVWPAGLGQAYCGRKRTRVADLHFLGGEGSEAAYGEGYTVEDMFRYIRKMDFSDLRLPARYKDWASGIC